MGAETDFAAAGMGAGTDFAAVGIAAVTGNGAGAGFGAAWEAIFAMGAGATDFAFATWLGCFAAGESNDGSDAFRGIEGLAGGLGAKPEARLTACSSGVAERRRGALGCFCRGAGAAAAAGVRGTARVLRTRGSFRRC